MAATALAALLWMSGCTNAPDSYPPPIQWTPPTGQDQTGPGSFADMGDAGAGLYIVRGVSPKAEDAGWRWTYEHPELEFGLSTTENLKFVMDYAIPDVTFKQTGPATISLLVNGHLLERIHIDQPGQKHFEKPVPAEWLRTDTLTLVAVEIDKLYVSPRDGVKLGFILSRAGFVD